MTNYQRQHMLETFSSLNSCTHKGTVPSVNLRFESGICRLVEPNRASKTVKAFVPSGLWSGVLVFLLNFRPIVRY